MGNRKIDEVGNRHNRLVVLEEAGRDNWGSIIWKCRCDCGNELLVTGVSLRRNNTKSCGCLRKEISAKHAKEMAENNKLCLGQANFNNLYHQYKKNAEARELIFELTKEDFSFLTKMNCFYCGCEPTQERDMPRCNGVYTYNGIDRIDNSKGYTIDNVVPCCSLCNWQKKDMTVLEFISHAQKITEHRNT